MADKCEPWSTPWFFSFFRRLPSSFEIILTLYMFILPWKIMMLTTQLFWDYIYFFAMKAGILLINHDFMGHVTGGFCFDCLRPVPVEPSLRHRCGVRLLGMWSCMFVDAQWCTWMRKYHKYTQKITETACIERIEAKVTDLWRLCHSGLL